MTDIIKKIFRSIQNKGVNIIETINLSDNSWFYVNDELLIKKIVYIFRHNGELLISTNGEICKGTWESINHATNSIMLTIRNKSILYNIIYLSSEYLVLQQDGTETMKIFVKQERYTVNYARTKNNNPVELIFGDLYNQLNSENIRLETKNNKTENIQLPVIHTSTENNQVDKNIIRTGNSTIKGLNVNSTGGIKEISNVYAGNLITKTVDINTIRNSIDKGFVNIKNDVYYDYLLHLEYFRGIFNGLTNSEEVDIILNLQENEEDMISENLVVKIPRQK